MEWNHAQQCEWWRAPEWRVGARINIPLQLLFCQSENEGGTPAPRDLWPSWSISSIFHGGKTKDSYELIDHYNCCCFSSIQVALNCWVWKRQASKWSLSGPLSRQKNKTFYQLIWWITRVIFILFIRDKACRSCLFLHALVNNSIKQIFIEILGRAARQSPVTAVKIPNEWKVKICPLGLHFEFSNNLLYVSIIPPYILDFVYFKFCEFPERFKKDGFKKNESSGFKGLSTHRWWSNPERVYGHMAFEIRMGNSKQY